MRRKLTAAIFAVSTLTSGLVHALGLGEVTVRSSLNQPLNAEIELLSVKELTEREIITALASREDFLRANVERTYFLSDIRFKVEMKPGGGALIRITSSRPVKEPYLNFLLEVNWPTGRLLREYALLIDPPTFSSEAAAPVIAASATTAQNRASAAPGATGRATTRPGAAAPSRAASGEYGPVAPNETLWSVAMQTKPVADITAQQMMLALQDANPEAFLDNNINRLKAGIMLRVPTEAEVTARSSREAMAQVAAQNRAFAEGRSAPSAATESASRQPGTGLTASRPAASRDQLRIVVDSDMNQEARSAAVSGTASTSGGGDAELALAKEQLDQAEREKADLQGRVDDLENQLETLQRLMSLKDEKLAVLQARLGQSGEDQVPLEISGSLDGTATTPEAEVAGETLTNAVEEPATVALTSPGSDSQQAAAIETVQTDVQDAGSDASVAKPGSMIEEKPVIKPRETVAPVAPAEKDWFTLIKENPIYQLALGAGGLLLLLILWLLSRSRAKKEHEFLERQQDGGETEDKVFEGLDFKQKSAKPAPTAEASEPLAEADVYIAYKRYDQAAKLLTEAAEQEPDNTAVRLKLLEVAGEAKDKALFQSTLAALLAFGIPAVDAEAERLQGIYAADLDEAELSLDDLESQLLSGNLPEQKSIAEDLDIEETPGIGPRPDDTLVDEGVAQEEDNLDIDFDLGEIDIDESLNRKDEDATATALDLDAFEGSELAAPAEGLDDTINQELDQDSRTSSLESDKLDETLEQELDSSFDLGQLEEESLENELLSEDPLDVGLDRDLSDELKELERPLEPAKDELESTLEEDLSLDLDESDLDFAADESLDLEQSLDELDRELGQVEQRVQSGEAEADDISDADFSDELLDTAGLEESAELSEDLLDSSDASVVDPDFAVSDEELAKSKALGDNFDDDLEEEDFEFLSGTDEVATKLDLARAYIDMGDKDGARDILEEVLEEGNSEQKEDAQKLIGGLS